MLTTQEALVALATTSSNAAAGALRQYAHDEVATGPVSVTLPGRDPLETVDVPAVIATITHAEAGGMAFVMSPACAQRLAGAVHDEPAADGAQDGEPTERELDAVREAVLRMADAIREACADTLPTVPGEREVDVRVAQATRDMKLGFQGSMRATLAIVSVFGEPCRLVQLFPSARLAQMTVALSSAEPHGAGVRDALGATLREVPLRVWAEVGRTRLRTAEAASLRDGEIIELDRAADDPVDVYVNGSRIATGRLVCIDGKDWAVRLEDVFAAAEADPAA